MGAREVPQGGYHRECAGKRVSPRVRLTAELLTQAWEDITRCWINPITYLSIFLREV